MRAPLSCLEREGLPRRAAREWPTHPKARTLWQPGDFGTPDKLVCGRCFAVLATRRHEAGASG